MQADLMGDAVNTAKRVEQLNKELGTCLLIGEPTFGHVWECVTARPHSSVRVKGKAEALTVYEVVEFKG
jgi:adenylate cyclase